MSNNTKAMLLAALIYTNAWFVFWISGGHLFTSPAFMPSAIGAFLAGLAYFVMKDYK
jgi:hypothetical protein